MNKFETEVLKKLDTIMAYTQLQPKDTSKKLELEDHNFKVNSDGWKKITVNEESYLENPEKDIWEILDGEGEQLFTWDAAMRETKKAGKRMPTDDEFTEILKTKDDIKNLALAGYRSTAGAFYYRTTYAYLWSSTPNGGNAWTRRLYSGHATVYRYYNNKAYGFSVRVLKS